MMSAAEVEKRLALKGSGRNCSQCIHVNVCALYRAIAPLLNQFEERKPFKPEDLALICKEYMPVVTMPTTPA